MAVKRLKCDVKHTYIDVVLFLFQTQPIRLYL